MHRHVHTFHASLNLLMLNIFVTFSQLDLRENLINQNLNFVPFDNNFSSAFINSIANTNATRNVDVIKNRDGLKFIHALECQYFMVPLPIHDYATCDYDYKLLACYYLHLKAAVHKICWLASGKLIVQ